jgi:hypothetical protein
MTEYLEFLKATADKPTHACRLVSKVEQTETKLETMYAPDAHRMRGIGLSVRLNSAEITFSSHLSLCSPSFRPFPSSRRLQSMLFGLYLTSSL